MEGEGILEYEGLREGEGLTVLSLGSPHGEGSLGEKGGFLSKLLEELPACAHGGLMTGALAPSLPFAPLIRRRRQVGRLETLAMGLAILALATALAFAGVRGLRFFSFVLALATAIILKG